MSDRFIYLPSPNPAPLFILERNTPSSFDCHQMKYKVIAVFGTLVQLLDEYFILGVMIIHKTTSGRSCPPFPPQCLAENSVSAPLLAPCCLWLLEFTPVFEIALSGMWKCWIGLLWWKMCKPFYTKLPDISLCICMTFLPAKWKCLLEQQQPDRLLSLTLLFAFLSLGWEWTESRAAGGRAYSRD